MSLHVEKDFGQEALDRRIIKTRQVLENSMMDLMQIKELQEISVQEITNHANVNRATFYDHFQDKNDLFEKVVTKKYREYILDKLEKGKSCDEPDFKNLIIGTYEFLRNHRGNCPSKNHIHRGVAEAKIQEQIFYIVNRWLQNQYNDEIQSIAISWAIFGATSELARMPSENKTRLKFLVNYIIETL